jgi:ABC-type nitrate/sulfonate/bicarbonate transport system permease component
VPRAWALSIEVLRPVPSVALIPLAMLVFGFACAWR